MRKNEHRPRREHDFGVQVGPRWHPRRPKMTGPRSSWIGFCCLVYFRFDLGSFSAPFWCRFGCQNAPHGGGARQIDPLGVQDGLEIVVVRFSYRLVVWDRFFGCLGLLLGSFLGAPGVVLVLFRLFNSSIQPVNSSTRRFNSSTHQPMALRHFLTRPGGLRAARLNNDHNRSKQH